MMSAKIDQVMKQPKHFLALKEEESTPNLVRRSSSYEADSLAKIWPLLFTRAGYILKGRGSAVDCKARHPES